MKGNLKLYHLVTGFESRFNGISRRHGLNADNRIDRNKAKIYVSQEIEISDFVCTVEDHEIVIDNLLIYVGFFVIVEFSKIEVLSQDYEYNYWPEFSFARSEEPDRSITDLIPRELLDRQINDAVESGQIDVIKELSVTPIFRELT